MVGVFTKFDVAGRDDAENVSFQSQFGTHVYWTHIQTVSIIENKQIPLELGWFVVQNRSSDADVSFDREKEENETLSKFPWLDLSPQRRVYRYWKDSLRISSAK